MQTVQLLIVYDCCNVRNACVELFVNKSAQINLGTGPRRGAVAHVAHNGAPQIRPQKYPSPWTDPQTPLPASSLDPSDL